MFDASDCAADSKQVMFDISHVTESELLRWNTRLMSVLAISMHAKNISISNKEEEQC